MATLNGVNYSNTSGLLLKTNATTQMSISTGGVIEFNQSYTFPTSDGSANTVLLTNGSGALSFSTIPNASLDNSSFTLGSTSVSLGDTASSIAGLTSITADTVYANSVLRISQNGDGLRMTNVGAFDNDGSNNFRIFSTNDLILSTNGESGTAVTFDSSSKDATFQGQVIAPTISATTINTSGDISVGTLGDTNDILIVGSGKTITSTDVLSINPTSKFVGINQSNPEVTLHMTGEGAQTAQIRMEQYNDSADAPDVRTRRYRGTIASPSAVQSGDYLYRSNHEYWNGSSLLIGGAFAFDNTNNANRTEYRIAVDTDGTGGDILNGWQFKIDGNDSGAITFNDAYKFPTSDGTNGQVLSTNGSGVVSWSSAAAGTVTSVGITAGALIDVSNSPITTSGNITVAVDLSELTTSTTNGDGDFFAVIDSSNVQRKLTKGSIDISGFNNDAGYTTNTGTVTSVAISGTDGIDVDSGSPITSSGTITLGLSNIPNSSLANSSVTVTAGSGLANGGSVSLGGSVTLNVGAGTGIQVNANDVALDYAGTDNFIDSATNLEGTDIALTDTIVYHDATDNNVKKGLVSDLPFSNNSGTVTSVGITAGALIDVSNSPITTSGNITVAVDLSELSTSTSNGDGDFFVVVDTANAQKKLTKGNINISGFNNDAGFTTNTGTVTSVAISGSDGIDIDSGSPITGSGTIALGLSNVPNSSLANSSITINGTAVSLGGSIDVGDITEVTAGNGLTGGGSSGSVTLNVGAGTGISVAADTVGLDTSNTRNVDHASVSISAGTGLSGGGTIASNRTISLDYAGTDNFIDSATNLEGTGIALTDTIVYHDATDNNVKKGLVSDLPFTNSSGSVTSVAISGTDGIDVDSGSPITTSGTITLGLSNVPNASLANSSVTVTAGNGLANGGSVSLGGSVTLNVGAGTGLVANANDVALDYAGTNNFIDSATNLEGTGIALTDTIVYHDATDNNVKKGLVSDLPYTNSSGSVTSVAISGSDGIDVDSGSPITSSGTIALGLSNVPNSSLANSSVTVNGGDGLTGGGSAALGGSVTLNVGAGTLIDVDGSNVNVDLSELTTSTSNADGDFFVVVDSSNNQKKLTKGNINNSGFNNDAGYITSAGNTNIYSSNGSLSAARTVTQNGNNLRLLGDVSQSRTEFAANNGLNWAGSPRVLAHADDNYTGAIETWTEGGAQFHIRSYDAGQNPVFFVDQAGNLVATSKAFDIPHPSPEKKEQGMRLKHGNLEGPEHGVYFRGRQLNDKEIELPEYWRDLVDPDSITVQLTSVGSHQNLYVKEIKNNVVYIGNGNLFSNKIDCYYFIQGERKDIDKIQVEYTQQ
jgi:hypothetical protein